ncbi:MAG: Segregation and condensation protein A [Candidatus Kaiserbacteria bacterium GW2011_GWC2_49_12]|uniref:Segregation and condensation protein A n=5 Tax=Candidatus Kaiseribacteriota TaxID=1752734 RepID=A0A0G1ZER0_9BACT|nr:MAG: Segregation and condensation protein A [Candidatus Kaiserbacteria bacterium GW2011_GWC2_49_12]KKW09320.1 MAG: Segregation and condensation protein A [Candidatus Kaiserbacteria bacterium GW2011_GWA2_49_56]KKW17704.1 MAG: Segregation and condensation protein A [Candidatus Kaiserbacteria bacterium GW2011_GWB1_50_17]KKW18317.1 MAG: Segregation and condensation protein A [Candidatus Kaiserbacteria bacterium GW2011_GWA1_50_28]OGG87157.1 MAG: hypothetical protein A3H15_02060 [Candidatus Kaiser
MNEKFHIETTAYQGPLETLLNLIEERKLSVSEVSLAEVCDAYLAYVEKLPELPLGETAQFILVASTLLLIKSRTLLPTLSLSEEEKESVEELERRLARYTLVRKAAKLLRREWGKTPLMLRTRAPIRMPVFAPAEATLERVSAIAKRLVSMLPKPEKLAQVAVAPILALEDVITSLKVRIASALKARFSELTRSRNKQETIVYFLATLELVRSGSISATQERLFEDITLVAEMPQLPRYGA